MLQLFIQVCGTLVVGDDVVDKRQTVCVRELVAHALQDLLLWESVALHGSVEAGLL